MTSQVHRIFTTGDAPIGKVFVDHNASPPHPMNSHVQNLYAPDPDPNMEVVAYERTWRQNEDLGLNHMKSYSGDDTKDGDIATQRS
jgi:hypothetical protein